MIDPQGLAVLAVGFGAPAPEVTPTGIRWPAAKVAVVTTAHDARQANALGWHTTVTTDNLPGVAEAITTAVTWLGVNRDRRNALYDAICVLAAHFGCPRPPTRHTEGPASLGIAWVDAKVAIVLPGEHPAPFKRCGWATFNPNGNADQAVRAIRAAALHVLAADSRDDATNGSSHEQRIAKALLDTGIPQARRNLQLRRPGGSIYSKPDFAWPDAKLILEVDGWYFHSAEVLAVLLAHTDVDAARRALAHGDRTRFERDAKKRRLATLDGWLVITCTDIEIDRDGPNKIATEVAQIYRNCIVSVRDRA